MYLFLDTTPHHSTLRDQREQHENCLDILIELQRV